MLISNDYTRLLQFSIIDKQKNDDDTIIAIKNIDISSFMNNYPYLLSKQVCLKTRADVTEKLLLVWT